MSLHKDLEHEHREIDQGIESFTAGSGDVASRTGALADALRSLRRHIYVEEELLFPVLQDGGLVPPLVVMRREHGEMWESMDEVSEGLASGADPSALRGSVDQLVAQIQTHNMKEESIVYPAVDRMIPEPAQGELGAQLASAAMPDAWICEAARS